MMGVQSEAPIAVRIAIAVPVAREHLPHDGGGVRPVDLARSQGLAASLGLLIGSDQHLARVCDDAEDMVLGDLGRPLRGVYVGLLATRTPLQKQIVDRLLPL